MTIQEELEQLDQSYWDAAAFRPHGLMVENVVGTKLKARRELMRKYFQLKTPEVLIPLFLNIDCDEQGLWDLTFFFSALEKFKKAELAVTVYQKVLSRAEKAYWAGMREFRKRMKYSGGNPADIDPDGDRTHLYEDIRCWLRSNYQQFKNNVGSCSQLKPARRKELIKEIDSAMQRICLEQMPVRKIIPDQRELTEAVFWELIETTHTEDVDDHLEALRDRLAGFPPKQIRQFKKHLKPLLKVARTWDLWGAGELLQGGCSDDGFEYFICWLILQGKHHFERAIAKADSIASWVKYNSDNMYEAEELHYLADELIEELTGNPGSDPFSAGGKVQGVQWKDDEELRKRLPKLHKLTSK